ncbi:unnamed protein product [Eruca vesicaria subsp. sativa]|uniref:Uncharacterized protein n=1 Tax=Eruca vesicaria subsp. sativa TaxID=29727 RepID=A0ABC8LFF0_ERUVS|nr:unnamed protein product [Eruca vesicaria subsp. sativa]
MDGPTETGIEISDDSNSFEEISAVSDHSDSSSPVTPKTDRIPVAITFGSPSSDVSPNHDSDSSFSELDSEAEAFYSSLNYRLVSPGTMDGHEFSDKQISYRELMKKFVQCEEELRTTTLKLQDSEQEVERLKGEAEKRESAVLLGELETARREIEMKDAVTLEMKRQVVDLESQLSDSTLKFGNLVIELEVSKGCLAVSDAEISKLGEMLCDCQQNFSTEKTKLETDIAGLLEKQTFLEAQVRDFDNLKLRYDMLMAEKDGVCVEVENLKAEMGTRDIQIKQMEEQLNQIVYRETELVSESENAKNIMEELREMVKELEKQAELQRNALSEGEEEKREAIRQLCFSLDHYKSGYRQLLRFLSNK